MTTRAPAKTAAASGSASAGLDTVSLHLDPVELGSVLAPLKRAQGQIGAHHGLALGSGPSVGLRSTRRARRIVSNARGC